MPPFYNITFRDDAQEVIERAEPWLAGGAIDYLDKNLTEDMIGVEFGGGGSTLWLCKRLKLLYTFEADHNWSIGLLDTISKSVELRKKWVLHFVNCTWHVNLDGSVSETKGFWNKHIDELSREEQSAMETAFLEIGLPTKVDVALVDGAVRYLSLDVVAKWMRENPKMLAVVDNTEGRYGERANEIFPDTHERVDFADSQKERISRGADWGQTSIWVPKS
ncbi:hypothetical protein HFP57_17480 [Parasphingopyxis algicola]|uniref:hypothetical protein n=1 Tax=Parasphingopyxis algicola TaxID=2026624 RepID=UPI0015A471F5|nr:hypothetical protein [Parasphingopyxis algicola]QLC26649.1 hypothetical protein HFP57_17480 [Parasphingopyxis algicola]